MAFRDISWVAERTNLWDGIGVLAYGVVFALVESIVIFLVLALLGLFTPVQWHSDRRVAFLGLLILLTSLWGMISQLLFIWNVFLPAPAVQFLRSSSHPFRILYGACLAVVSSTILLPVYLFMSSKKSSPIDAGSYGTTFPAHCVLSVFRFSRPADRHHPECQLRHTMNKRLNRRDVLKLAGLLPIGLSAPRLLRMLNTPFLAQGQSKNVIVIVFDAFSAYDISLYGYARQTTPNIDRLANRAVVYHNHFAGGNFTTPGTASLLTGVLPWTHRALNLNSQVAEPYIEKNIFSAFPDYYRIAYTHNGFANTFLRQFQGHLDELIPRESLYLQSYDSLISSLFNNDDDIASISWIRAMKVNEEGSAYSLFLSHLYESLEDRKLESLKPLFPRGLPTVSLVNPYVLETAIDAIKRRLTQIPQPFVGYFHFMPPHHPYRTSHDFFNRF